MRRISTVVVAASSIMACVLAPRPVHAQAASAALAPDTSWVARSALYEVNVRDFSAGGNLAGVTAGLARIRATGADVIWLMPIFPVGVLNAKGPLGSPYAVRDYDAINPDFGTAADLGALVRAAHARGMKVILDWVPDHTAWDAVWIRCTRTTTCTIRAASPSCRGTSRAIRPTGPMSPSSTTGARGCARR